ncbi:hypothetical protein IE81DRAFT_140158 [Ceraceosorus guamensis]|uniref:Uncharacterized protein n=1 Tax=Ceraceosorus guamensis TaxID=1522189 RepID=A0A316VY06_9BASI|nr:hypothetical protein IE81DRAFT_140158 [Ceraceosorus guamensis]PWN42204.1 hypothetical protein IE81DRAFT_140158 [Ceraceosorus guamensis]
MSLQFVPRRVARNQPKRAPLSANTRHDGSVVALSNSALSAHSDPTQTAEEAVLALMLKVKVLDFDSHCASGELSMDSKANIVAQLEKICPRSVSYVKLLGEEKDQDDEVAQSESEKWLLIRARSRRAAEDLLASSSTVPETCTPSRKPSIEWRSIRRPAPREQASILQQLPPRVLNFAKCRAAEVDALASRPDTSTHHATRPFSTVDHHSDVTSASASMWLEKRRETRRRKVYNRRRRRKGVGSSGMEDHAVADVHSALRPT